jgi:hypothetical protein
MPESSGTGLAGTTRGTARYFASLDHEMGHPAAKSLSFESDPLTGEMR